MKGCPFCKCDPYDYADVGIGMVPVAVTCCELMVDLSRGDKKARQILEFRRSYSPRKKARAQRMIQEIGYDV
jgi:hypothetical protein